MYKKPVPMLLVTLAGCSYNWKCEEPALIPFCDNYIAPVFRIHDVYAEPNPVVYGNDVSIIAKLRELEAQTEPEEVTVEFPEYNMEQILLSNKDNENNSENDTLLYETTLDTTIFSTKYVLFTVDTYDSAGISSQYNLSSYFEINGLEEIIDSGLK